MRARILLAVSAWLLGAATATGGCLLAVSLLGDGFGLNGSSNQQLTAAAVNHALADADREPASAPAATFSRAARARPATRRRRAATLTPASAPTPPPTSAPATSTPTPAQSTTPVGTPFSSQGGTVVATCEAAGARLLSWSPAQGYEVDRVVPGPAAVASVSFESNSSELTMKVSCSSGTPVSSTTTSPGE